MLLVLELHKRYHIMRKYLIGPRRFDGLRTMKLSPSVFLFEKLWAVGRKKLRVFARSICCLFSISRVLV